MRLATGGGGRCFGEKVTEERRISVDIGCTRERQGKQAGREGAGSGKGEQGGPPKHSVVVGVQTGHGSWQGAGGK